MLIAALTATNLQP